MQFEEFPKMGRLTRECVITEKIDGTNAQVCIVVLPDGEVMPTHTPIVATRPNPDDSGGEHTLLIYAGSRNRYITPDADNFGFAAWVRDHADELVALGPGRHFGEWWGAGIQRRYGLAEKRFSLFNVARWHRAGDAPYVTESADPRAERKTSTEAPACCHVVPVLFRGLFGEGAAEGMIAKLAHGGSVAAPGFMDPEGIVIYHTAAGTMFKKTIKKDDQPKSKSEARPMVEA